MQSIVEKEPPLPDNYTEPQKITWQVPHILKSISIDGNGFTHRDIRQGGMRQLDSTIEVSFSNEPVPEEPIFVVRGTSQINFADTTINVVTDAVDLPEFKLVPSDPTAAEYLAKVGQKVMIHFRCVLDGMHTKGLKRNIFRTVRQFIILP